jgi:hypothetical protein
VIESDVGVGRRLDAVLRATLAGIVVGVALLATTAPAGAQATRTWVSGVGDDGNPCNRTAPCKTFANAISKTAAGGEISVLDPGGFGAVTITKSITIAADGALAGIGAAGTNGVIVNAGVADVVVLRGLTIEGLGTGIDGIRFLAGAALFVEDTTINNFAEEGIDFRPTGSAELVVSGSSIRENGGAGIRVTSASGTATATVSYTELERNAVGLDIRDNARAAVVNSAAVANTGAGFRAQPDAGAAEVMVAGSSAIGNGAGVLAGGGASAQPATIRLTETLITQNGTGVAVGTPNPGSVVTFGDAQIYGNGAEGVVPTVAPLR